MQVNILNKLMAARAGLCTFGFFGQINQFFQILETNRNGGAQPALSFYAHANQPFSVWPQTVVPANRLVQGLNTLMNKFATTICGGSSLKFHQKHPSMEIIE